MNENLVSNTPRLYKFVLVNTETDEQITLRHSPLEWADATIELNRKLEVGGIFTLFTASSLTFIKEGRWFLERIFDEKEINGQAELRIFRYNKQHQYEEMPNRFALLFNTYKRVKVGGASIGANFAVERSSFLTKLENRKKVKVDITKKVSVGGFEIIDYSSLAKVLRFGEINAYRKAELTYDGNGIPINYIDDVISPLAMSRESSDFNEVQSEFFNNIQEVNLQQFAVFRNSEEDRQLSISLNFDLSLSAHKTGSEPQAMWSVDVKVYRKRLDGSGNSLNSKLIASDTVNQSKENSTQTFGYSETLDILAGESVGFYVYVTVYEGNTTIEFLINANNLVCNFSEGVISSEGTVVEAFPIYEAFERCSQLILDSQFPFYSEFFGRTDTPYNPAGSVYSIENQLRFASILSGMNIRGAKVANQTGDTPIAFTWEDIYMTAKACWNVGYQIEEIDNFMRVRVEEYAHFFDPTVVIDLSERLNDEDIEKEVLLDLAYLSIKTGYKEFEYEEINGRGEYNSTNERTSIINSDKTFDNIAPFRADTRGVTLQLEREVNTVDEKEDAAIFIIKTQRNAAPNEDWIAEYEQNVSFEPGTSLFEDGSLNLYLTPTRNLIRNSNRITGAFQKYLSSFLRFQVSGKSQILRTTGEGFTVTESDDLMLANLDAPIYKPFAYTVTVPFDYDDLKTVLANPNGVIKFSDTVQGYLLNLKKKNGEDQAEIKIIEKH